MVEFSQDLYPQLEITFGGKHAKRLPEIVDVEAFIGAKSFRAKGKRLTHFEVAAVRFIEPLEKEMPESVPAIPEPTIEPESVAPEPISAPPPPPPPSPPPLSFDPYNPTLF